MEDRNDKRSNEIVSQPQNEDEAKEMLKQVEALLDKFSITGPFMSGNMKEGYSWSPNQ